MLDDGNQYVYGAGLTAQKQSGNWYYYLADGLGSTMAVVNSSGTVQDSYTYDVYGKPTKTGSLSNEFDFAGQQTDGTGLQYLRARYYDPGVGAFLSRDPLAAAATWLGLETGYGTANPAKFADPWGLKPIEGDGCEPWCFTPRVKFPETDAGTWLEAYSDGYGGYNVRLCSFTYQFPDSITGTSCSGGFFAESFNILVGEYCTFDYHYIAITCAKTDSDGYPTSRLAALAPAPLPGGTPKVAEEGWQCVTAALSTALITKGAGGPWTLVGACALGAGFDDFLKRVFDVPNVLP